jgi:hypothetical protein
VQRANARTSPTCWARGGTRKGAGWGDRAARTVARGCMRVLDRWTHVDIGMAPCRCVAGRVPMETGLECERCGVWELEHGHGRLTSRACDERRRPGESAERGDKASKELSSDVKKVRALCFYPRSILYLAPCLRQCLAHGVSRLATESTTSLRSPPPAPLAPHLAGRRHARPRRSALRARAAGSRDRELSVENRECHQVRYRVRYCRRRWRR